MQKNNNTDVRLKEVLQDEADETQYYRDLLASNSSLPPAAVVSIQAILQDERDVPLYKEKVPYLVVFGEPGVLFHKESDR